ERATAPDETSLRDYRWGESISAERQRELLAKLRQWKDTAHSGQQGPFDGFQLTGADVYWLSIDAAPRDEGFGPDLMLQGANLSDARLEGAALSEARLERAVMRLARLKGASLRRAHLEGADLSAAHLEGADLSAAHLEGADLSAAHL